jgi:hypothetical protein
MHRIFPLSDPPLVTSNKDDVSRRGLLPADLMVGERTHHKHVVWFYGGGVYCYLALSMACTPMVNTFKKHKGGVFTK